MHVKHLHSDYDSVCVHHICTYVCVHVVYTVKRRRYDDESEVTDDKSRDQLDVNTEKPDTGQTHVTLPSSSSSSSSVVDSSSSSSSSSSACILAHLATLSKLHWLPVHDRIKFKIATMTHKAIGLHTSNPPYLANLVQWHTPCRTLRSASALSLIHI